MIDLGDNEYVRASGTSVAIFSYAEPWCGCGVLAGSRVKINSAVYLITSSYVGPAESPLLLVQEIDRRWGELVTEGTLTKGGPWIVALQVQRGEGPGLRHDCRGHWRFHTGWK